MTNRKFDWLGSGIRLCHEFVIFFIHVLLTEYIPRETVFIFPFNILTSLELCVLLLLCGVN